MTQTGFQMRINLSFRDTLNRELRLLRCGADEKATSSTIRVYG